MTNDAPYVHVSLTMRPDQSPHVGVSLKTSKIGITVDVVEDRRPLLNLSADGAYVSLSTTGGGDVTDADVATARALFNAAARYLADCERLRAEASV